MHKHSGCWLVVLSLFTGTGCSDLLNESRSFTGEFVGEVADEALEAGRETVRDTVDRTKEQSREDLRDSFRGLRGDESQERITVDEELPEDEEE